MAAPTTTERNGYTPRGPGRAPVGAGSAPLTVRTANRNRVRVVLGAALIVGSAFAAAVVFSGTDHRTAALTIARRVPAGHVIEASDLRQSMVSAPANAIIAASASGSVVGRLAAVDLIPGSLLARSQIATRGAGGAATASLGVLLAEGRYPSGLAAGDRVLVVEVPAASSGPEEPGDGGQQFPATVESVGDGTNDGTVDVTLAVAPDDASAIAALGARGRIALVVTPS